LDFGFWYYSSRVPVVEITGYICNRNLNLDFGFWHYSSRVPVVETTGYICNRNLNLDFGFWILDFGIIIISRLSG